MSEHASLPGTREGMQSNDPPKRRAQTEPTLMRMWRVGMQVAALAAATAIGVSIVAIIVSSRINPSFGASLNDAPFSTWYGLLIWFVLFIFALMFMVSSLVWYKQAPLGTSRRRRMLLATLSQVPSLAAALAYFILGMLKPNYAAVAAFGVASALSITALKLMGGGALST